MYIPKAAAYAAVTLASTCLSIATFQPSSDGPSYAVGIPSSSSISSSSTGGIYLQLSAPTSYQWVGLGIGQRMAGATIFVMYADGNGNVTISARSGTGQVQPLLDQQIQDGVTLLAGSGIVGSSMIANVLCTTCTLKSGRTDSSSPFIAAWGQGSALNTASTSATIRQHSGNAFAQFTFDLTAAVLASNSNPFISSTTTTSGSASPTSTSVSGGSSGSGSSTVVGSNGNELADYRKAHGIIMGVTMVLIFPLGAAVMRSGMSAAVHGAWQLFGLCALIAGTVLGIQLANKTSRLYNNTHTIFGIVILVLFLVQPIFGIFHHWQFRKTQSRTPVSHVHIWYGRGVMVLGVINGGLGLKLAANTEGGEIAYGVVAGVVGVAYIAVVCLKPKSRRDAPGQEMQLRETSSSDERKEPPYSQVSLP